MQDEREGPCILVVDDDETLAGGLAYALSQKGLKVAVGSRGKVVPEMIASVNPDALLLDISLPDLNGITVARIVRWNWPHLPIIFVTGHDNMGEINRALGLPRTSIVRKPFSLDVLLQAIEKALAS